MKYLTIIGLPLLWVSLQYPFVVPVVFLWYVFLWLLKGAGKVGLFGILLICLPIIGWAILAIILVMRAQHRETLAAFRPEALNEQSAGKPKYYVPWGLDQFKAALR